MKAEIINQWEGECIDWSKVQLVISEDPHRLVVLTSGEFSFTSFSGTVLIDPIDNRCGLHSAMWAKEVFKILPKGKSIQLKNEENEK